MRMRRSGTATASYQQPIKHVTSDPEGGQVPNIYDSTSGCLDAEKIGSLFGLTLEELAQTLECDIASIQKSPDAPSLQPRLALFERITAPLLYLVGTEENFRDWLNTPNPDLEDQTPLKLIKQGSGEIVAELLEDTLVGLPA